MAAFGGLAYDGSLNRLLSHPIVGLAAVPGGNGYWLADANGTVFAIGDAHSYGSLPVASPAKAQVMSRVAAPKSYAADAAARLAGAGDRAATAADHLGTATRQAATHTLFAASAHGAAPARHATPARHAAAARHVTAARRVTAAGHVSPSRPSTGGSQHVVGMAATPDGHGYWLAAAGGGVFSFGDAHYYGSRGLSLLRAPVVGIDATPDGRGYWLVASDGGVFTFGDARYFGSAVGDNLPAPVVGMAATANGQGYRLVTSDGAVYDFGDADFFGPRRAPQLSSPIVGITSAPAGQGYWLFGANGSVMNFGSAPYRGSGEGTLPYHQSVAAMVAEPTKAQGGKMGVESTGAFGTGSPSKLTGPVIQVTTAPPRKLSLSSFGTYPAGAKGYDVSWPQCGRAMPPQAKVAVVGVNGGMAFTGNPCFYQEAEWAGGNLSTYINLNSPRGSHASEWVDGPAGKCAPGNLFCQSYNYGFNTAQFSVQTAVEGGAHSKTWWLDVETSADWSFSQRANARVVAGAIDALRANGLTPAIYSTTYQWDIITGGYVPGTSAWYPTGTATKYPSQWCTARSFAGGPVSLVQSQAGRFDGDYSC